MLILKYLLLLFLPVVAFANNNDYLKFDKTVSSKNITPECDHIKNDENAIFTLTYKDIDMEHEFYIMKGIPTQTCYDHLKKINRIKSHSQFVTISADRGSLDDSNPKKMIWTFKYIKTNKECDSHFENYCYPKNHPHKMY